MVSTTSGSARCTSSRTVPQITCAHSGSASMYASTRASETYFMRCSTGALGLRASDAEARALRGSTLGRIEKLFAYDLVVLDREQPNLVHLHASTARLVGHIVGQAHREAIAVWPRALELGAVNLVVCHPLLALLPDGLQPARFGGGTR